MGDLLGSPRVAPFSLPKPFNRRYGALSYLQQRIRLQVVQRNIVANPNRVYLAQSPTGAILSTPTDAPNFKPSEGGVNDGICGRNRGERGYAQFGFVVIERGFDWICYNSRFVVRVRSYRRLKLPLGFIDFSAASKGRNPSP